MGKTGAAVIQYQDLLAKAVRLRLAKTPYDEIIARLGHWNSIQACQKAVSTYLKRNQAKNVADSRAEAIAILEDQLFEMRAKFKKSKSRFDSAEIRKLIREISLLNGDYAPTKLAHEGKDGGPVKTEVRLILPPASEE